MTFDLSQERKDRLDELVKRYPTPQSAAMSALYLVQEEHGFISDQAIQWIAKRLEMTSIRVRELASFYTMYKLKPVGKYHMQMCRTLTCAVCGTKQLVEYVTERLKIKPGEVTPDGMWSLEQVECLGSCGTAPVCEINDTYFENLNPEKLGEIMDRIEAEQPDLSYSTLTGKLGSGLEGYPKSQIV